MTDLAHQAMVPNVTTGEVLIVAESSTEQLGEARNAILDLEGRLRDHKATLDVEIVARMDADACWTLRAGEWKLSAPSPAAKTEWDAVALREALLALVDDGTITAGAVDAAVEPVVSYRARAKGIGALRKLGGRVAGIVAAHETLVDPVRRVTVRRDA